MKDLEITYNGLTLFRGTVSEFAWQESDSQVTATARPQREQPAAGRGAGSIMDMLVARRKEATAAANAERREAMHAAPEIVNADDGGEQPEES